MDEYLDELKAGKIQFRDKWQFELKTELLPIPRLKENIQTQEFYFFIPNSLQINDQTYSKTQFYLDQTNLIRFKTPAFTFKELSDPNNSESPLMRILMLIDYAQSQNIIEEIQSEIKLLGNIFHSALREEMAEFVSRLDTLQVPESVDAFQMEFDSFCEALEKFRAELFNLQKEFLKSWSSTILSHEFDYIDEFISSSIHEYLAGFLNWLRYKSLPELSSIEPRLCEILIQEKKYREEKFQENNLGNAPHFDEYVHYRNGLLNKFMIDPLLLKTNRAAVERRFRGVILGIPEPWPYADFLAEAAPNLKLVIGAGRYGDPKLIAETEQMPNVVLTDYLGLDELPCLIKRAKALLILSRYETFGIPVVEAMAVGTPVIAARFAALPEIVGDAGLLVNATQPAEILGALLALDEVEKREQYRRLGFLRVQQFTWEACASRLLAGMKEATRE